MTQRTVVPLFSTPVYVNNVGEFEQPDIRSLEYTNRLPNGGVHYFLTSGDKNVLDRPSFSAVRAVVMREIEVYAREVLRVSKNVQFYVTNSWVIIYRRGEHAGNRLVDRASETPALRSHVDERDGRGVETGALIHGVTGSIGVGAADRVIRSAAADRSGDGPRSASPGSRGSGWRFRGWPRLPRR